MMRSHWCSPRSRCDNSIPVFVMSLYLKLSGHAGTVVIQSLVTQGIINHDSPGTAEHALFDEAYDPDSNA